MKVLIIFPPLHPVCNSLGMRAMPPLSIYYLSAILKHRGFDVRIIDPTYFLEQGFFTSYNDSLKMLNEFISEQYDLIAISANSGNWSMAKFFIDLFKEIEKEIPIAVGGVHATYYDEYILSTTKVDYVVRGEGEEALTQLLGALNNWEKLRNIKGITYRDKNGDIIKNPDNELIPIDRLDEYPSPDYDLIPAGYYEHIPVESSRGCKYNCLFCSVPHRRTWRPMKKENIIERVLKVKGIVDKGITIGNNIFFVDDCFSAEPTRAIDLLHTLDSMSLDLTYGIECRITDLLKPNFIERIPKNIIKFIQIGVESGYDEGLRKIRKGITVKQVEECAKLLKKYDLLDKAYYSFILGFPWEDVIDIEKTANYIGYLGAEYGIATSVSWLWLCPSDLWFSRDIYNVNFSEEIFDDCFWTINKNTFFASRPGLNMNGYDKIENTIDKYKSEGSRISHTRLFY